MHRDLRKENGASIPFLEEIVYFGPPVWQIQDISGNFFTDDGLDTTIIANP